MPFTPEKNSVIKNVFGTYLKIYFKLICKNTKANHYFNLNFKELKLENYSVNILS